MSAPVKRQENHEAHLYINAQIEGKNEKIELPQYALRYPDYNRVTLPTVKKGIYHASLPSVFRYAIDDYMNKRPIENARSSTKSPGEHFYFDQNEVDRSKISFPTGVSGDVEFAASVTNENEYGQAANFKNLLLGENFGSMFGPNQEAKRTSIIAGKENANKRPEQKAVSVFRYNRIRNVASDQATQGHMTSYFDTLPVIDQNNRRRVGVANGFAHRVLKEEGDKPAFRPYGNTSGHYKNYIMYYPRL